MPLIDQTRKVVNNQINAVDKYIEGFPIEVQAQLVQLRQAIRLAAPDADEVISYGMPAYRQKGILVYFAGYKSHIGFYPTASGIEDFKSELLKFKWSKGTIQFPVGQPLPIDLITRIVRFRVNVNEHKTKK